MVGFQRIGIHTAFLPFEPVGSRTKSIDGAIVRLLCSGTAAGKNVTHVNVGNGFSRLLDELTLSVVNIRICIAVEGDNALDDARFGRFAVRVIYLEEFDGFLPDVGQLWANESL